MPVWPGTLLEHSISTSISMSSSTLSVTIGFGTGFTLHWGQQNPLAHLTIVHTHKLSVRTSGTNFAPYFLVSSRGKFDQVHVLHLKIVSPQMHCLAVDCGTFSPCLQARDTVHVFPAST